ncbi:MAG: hypothetical protein HC834_09320, partial [Rhodospirillales bacterium]|nr:hypothetical protein [Rhodospirillales bacterium]
EGGLLGGATGGATGAVLDGARGLLKRRAILRCHPTLDESLGERAVISYQRGEPGTRGQITLRLGPGVSQASLVAHVEAALQIERYDTLLARLDRALGGGTQLAPGTAGFEARVECTKLKALLEERLRLLEGGTLGPEEISRLGAEIDVLQDNLKHYLGRIDDAGPGAGQIAQPEAPAGYPATPSGHHYYRTQTGEWDIRRNPEARVTPLTLVKNSDGAWDFVVREVGEERVYFPPGTTRKVALGKLSGQESTSSFKAYREMLERYRLASEDEILGAMMEPGGVGEDVVRHGLKEHFRDRVVARMFAAGDRALGESESIARMRQMLEGLNPADRGNLAEAWYATYRAKYYGEDLAAHPRLPKDNVFGLKLEGDRLPDFVEGDTLVEVKSTQAGLGPRDAKQIEDFLKAAKARANLILKEETRQVKRVRLVFTEVEGAQGSLSQLDRWFGDFKAFFEVEVLVGGKSQRATTTAQLKALLSK